MRNWPVWILGPAMMAVANSTSMTRDNAAIDPELFVVGFVILSCLAAAFTDGKRAAWPPGRVGRERGPGARRKAQKLRAPGAARMR